MLIIRHKAKLLKCGRGLFLLPSRSHASMKTNYLDSSCCDRIKASVNNSIKNYKRRRESAESGETALLQMEKYVNLRTASNSRCPDQRQIYMPFLRNLGCPCKKTSPLPSISSLCLCTRSWCSVGSMHTERILVGNRRLLPVSPKIIKCSRVSRNVTQFPFHSTFPAFPGDGKHIHYIFSPNSLLEWHK